MRWLVDGYNAIRRWPELAAAEQRHGLEGGRDALCALLSRAARASGDEFTVVFDGAQAGGVGHGGPGVRVIFSSARESADRVIAQMAGSGGAVVSSDREVMRAAARAGAVVITVDEFLVRIERLVRQAARPADAADPDAEGDGEEGDGGDDGEDAPRGPKKGNPRKLSKKRRAAERALGRLRSGP
jgi:predicted RNA-binding protein with PIN domain